MSKCCNRNAYAVRTKFNTRYRNTRIAGDHRIRLVLNIAYKTIVFYVKYIPNKNSTYECIIWPAICGKTWALRTISQGNVNSHCAVYKLYDIIQTKKSSS